MQLSKALLAATVASGVVFALPAAAAPVSAQRLLDAAAEPQNWLLVYGTYNNHMNSGLSQINRNTVGNLKPKFMVSMGGYEPGGSGYPSQQATPLVDNGFMYVNTGWNQVLKIDVRSGNRGEVLWENDPKTDKAYAAGRARGLALLDNNVFITTNDSRLVKVDANSGETIWEVSTKAAEAPDNQKHSGAPIAIKDMILAGQSNGSGGNRAWIAAFKAADGKPAWRWWVIPAPGEPGNETWKDGHNAWRTGGGSIWTTGAYDPETQLTIWGTGDPAPWGDPQFRPGDNLFTVSTVAINVNTGKLAWHFQETPNEAWDFDTVNPKMLYDITVGGQTRKVQGNFSRNGFFYTLDRTTGVFMFAERYLEVTWTAGLDPKTGRPLEYNPNTALQDYSKKSVRYNDKTTAQNVCPNFSGAPTYMPPTYDTRRQIAYTSGQIGCMDMFNTRALDPAQDWRGKSVGGGWTNPTRGLQRGNIYGIDVKTGKTVSRFITTYPIYSGLLGTNGDLVFSGHLDGKFGAYDKDTLNEVWSFNVGTPISAPPISYSVDGKQYIAVVAGGQLRGADLFPALNLVKRNSQVVVFGL